ncbi:MAG: hypothetical protein ACT443_09930 [Gemmatimonadota bacterium]
MDSNLLIAASLCAALLFAILYFRSLSNERRIRRDAVERSRSVTIGKVTDWLELRVPVAPGF